MKYESKVIQGQNVIFPEFTNERIYMVPFLKKDGLPTNLQRWQPTVDQMLTGIETDLPIYIMIDQSFVKAGEPQRRPGVHIDGYWIPEQQTHGSTHSKNSSLMLGSHGNRNGTHSNNKPSGSHSGRRSHGGHGPKQNNGGGHGGRRGGHGGRKNSLSSWSDADFKFPEAIILASNICASRGFVGSYEGLIKDMGDCAEIQTKNLKEVILEENKTYIGNVTFLHESLPVKEDSHRTLVRLNVPGFEF